ncbi:angiomotin-like isoform X2 [Homarus americanus]|uniref:angiomotin-like isoform X2 n=1 Tax=Homarus americanus TaxID=6706 RepID=UPI001C47C902|nr:angiomotin-like isoform X2 [Homarus americanus]
MMKNCIIVVCLAVLVSAAVALPPPGAGVPFAFSKDMISAFIPTAQEIAQLQALYTTPAPAAPALGPTPPPTMPPAVAALVAKYKAAAAAFAPVPAPI